MRVELTIKCNSCYKEIVADKKPEACICFAGSFFHIDCFQSDDVEIKNLRHRVNKAMTVTK